MVRYNARLAMERSPARYNGHVFLDWRDPRDGRKMYCTSVASPSNGEIHAMGERCTSVASPWNGEIHSMKERYNGRVPLEWRDPQHGRERHVFLNEEIYGAKD